MKLRNKETGEIVTPACFDFCVLKGVNNRGIKIKDKWYNSLTEISEDWEDYEKPSYAYWINTNSECITQAGCGLEDDAMKYVNELGLAFTSEEEAEKAVEKLKAWKRLKDNGFKIKGWKFTPDMKQIQGNYVKIEAEIPQILINEKDIDLLLSGEDD